MRAALRLAISGLRERPSRTSLLVATVALSAALIAAVACALASINRAVELRLQEVVGRADAKTKPASGRTFPDEVLRRIAAWPEVEAATGRLVEGMGFRAGVPAWLPDDDNPFREAPFRRRDASVSFTARVLGVDPDLEHRFRAMRFVAGRMPRAPGEVVIDTGAVRGLADQARVKAGSEPAKESLLRPGAPAGAPSQAEADRLGAEYSPGVGDTIEVTRFLRDPVRLTIVGVVAQPPFGGRWQVFMTREQLASLTGNQSRLSEVDVILRPGVDPADFVQRRRPELGQGVVFQTTAKITSGLTDNMQSNRLGFYLATTMAFLAAAFIIMTGLSTGVVEKQRELAVLRCVGASRGQLAVTQVLVGLFVGLAGACAGVPLGVGASYVLVEAFREHMPTGLWVEASGLATPVVAAALAGLLGAGYPAWIAARVSPLEGLGARARPPRTRSVLWLLASGLACVAFHLSIISLISDGQVLFWIYVTAGLPAMFIGYFLLSVPVLIAVTAGAAPVISRVLRLPGNLLGRGVLASPFRYGFTAGAMMSGLAIMVAIWTQGSAIRRDWLDRMQFPDAFAAGLHVSPEARDRIAATPWVTDSCAITVLPVDTEVFGVRALQRYKTSFVAFEIDPFLRMTNLTWVLPSDDAGRERAIERLRRGGAVVVAREFYAARGLGPGGRVRLTYADASHDFEIVGVVTSPGLEVIGKFFETGDQFADQAVHAVFGTRDDLRDTFGAENINIIQMNLAPGIGDDEAVARLRAALLDTGVLEVGSGRRMKNDLRAIIGASLLVSSTIALLVMFKAALGVANIVIAGVQARRFEFGVLRSVGATRGQLCRLVAGEAALIAVTAMFLGTLLGLQGVAGGQRLDQLLFGLELRLRPPPAPIAIGCAAVLAACIGAALPAIIVLARRSPRDLLAAMKG